MLIILCVLGIKVPRIEIPNRMILYKSINQGYLKQLGIHLNIQMLKFVLGQLV